MDRLKKILRVAIQDEAQRIKLQVGSPVEITTLAGPKSVDEDGAVDQDYIQKLYSFLFPHDKAALATKQPIKGALNVPNVGKILLIAQPSEPISLRLYLPPQGQAMFDTDWAQNSSKTVAPDPSAMVDMFGGAAPQPMAAPRLSMAPMAPVAAPNVDPLAGVDPAGFSLQFPVASLPPLAPPPPFQALVPPMMDMPEAPSLTAPIAPAMTMAPIVAAPPIQMATPPPIPVTAQMPVAPMQSQRPAVAPTSNIVVTSTPIEVAPEGDIVWGAEAPGESASSDGNNPIDAILIEMVKRKASDLHMTAGEPLCFRLDGEIQRITQAPSTPEDVERYLAPLIPARNKTEFLKIHDTDFAYEIRGVGRFRVNVFRDRMGVGSVMRHIPSKILTAEQLGLPPAITKFCQLTKGLVVVTGPTGSGKSTTLAAMVDLINKTRHDHILTVEDPIEFVHPQQRCLVNQREVHKHTTSFSRALKAALREDPDIVLIGEMRDLETVAIAIETAETGHLVFGTLHTNTAVSTIDRIVDQFPTDRQEQIRMMLSSGLKGVVAQTLLKKKGGGRIAAHEILVTNDAVSAMIREGKNHMIPNHMQSQKQDGNILLNESLLRLVKENLVEPHDAMMKAVDKNGLLENFKRANVKYDPPGMTPPAPPLTAPKAPGKQSA